MKRFYTSLLGLLMTISLAAADVQGWPANYGGVMLQGFYWDSYDDSKWTNLKSMAPELGQYFSLVWLPQSGNCGGTSMGYDDLYWFPGGNHYTSSFGTEAELRDLITTFKANNIGTIADVVINHRRNVSNWVDFPAETYGGVTYQMLSTDICANDDDGATLSWANSNGYSLSSNNDTGTGWDGMRDLDHKSANVQKSVKAYLKMLLNDLGYVGFRYDMVKGYSGSYTGIYNTDAAPEFSVGECWDGTTTIRNWIDATKVNGWPTSAAFDFQFRYVVRNAANNNWINLRNQNDGNYPLVSNNYDSGNYRRWAVTFVENHDTERRSNAEQDPLKKDTLAANAFMLAMPGTPCVFLTHWLDCKQDIKSMIDVRKAAGIHNQSVYQEVAYNNFYYAVKSGNSTSDYRLLAVVGKNANVYTPTDANFVKVLSGYHYAYYLNKSLGTAW
ncbi:MAG: alpha-amylase, partial [Prevotella sp.]|nr:alpha-amylase [Prevotella sp.]